MSWIYFKALLALVLVPLGGVHAQAAFPSNAGLAPQRVTMGNGKTAYSQLAQGEPVGTMVLLHGCGPGAWAFFPYDPVTCPECYEFPEFLAQTKQALARGYNVLAVQASNDGSNCWSSANKDGYVDDRPYVVQTVKEFLANTSAENLPVYVQGYSSGGTILLKLPAYIQQARLGLRIDGIVPVDVAPRGGFNAEDASGRLRKGLDFPPTVYVYSKQGGAAQRAPDQIRFLQDNGVPAAAIVSSPRKVGPSYFSDRVTGVTPEQSAQLVSVLKQLGAIDANGFATYDYWPYDAAAALLPWLAAAEQRLKDGMFTEMRIAFGDHENLGEFTIASLAWLESKGKADIDELVKELVPKRLSELTIARDGGFGVAEAVVQEGAPELQAVPAEAPAPAPAI